jgi:hypothetical protein
MTLGEVVKDLGLDVRTGQEEMDREVLGGYCSDLLSDVIVEPRKEISGSPQLHQLVAVVYLTPRGIIVGGREPDPPVKAEEQDVPFMISALTA